MIRFGHLINSWKNRGKGETEKRIERMFILSEEMCWIEKDLLKKEDVYLALIEEIKVMAETLEDVSHIHQLTIREYRNHQKRSQGRTNFLELFRSEITEEELFKAVQVDHGFPDKSVLHELTGYSKFEMNSAIEGLQKYAWWGDVRILRACEELGWDGQSTRVVLAGKITSWNEERRQKAVEKLTAEKVENIRSRFT